MVAVHREDADTALLQTLDAAAHARAPTRRAVSAIEQVAADHEELRVLLEAAVDQRIPRVERGIAHHVGEAVPQRPDARKRAVEVQIGGVDEASWHA